MTKIIRKVVTEEVEAELLEEVQIYRTSVVYFLFLSGELMYIGQSNSVHSAIVRHKSKEFDQIFIRRVDPEADLDLLEMSCIVYFRPKLNRTVSHRKISMAEAASTTKKFLGIDK